MKQNDFWDDWNGSSLLDLHVYQVGVADIGAYTGLEFAGLAQLDEFEWRQVRFRDRSRMGPIPIRGPEDIDLSGTRRRRARGVHALRYVLSHEAGPAGGTDAEANAASNAVGTPTAPITVGASAGPAEVRPPVGQGSGDCGCREGHPTVSMDERVEALGRQVAALRDLVEGLLEEDQTVDERTRSDLRQGARRTFARIVGGQMVGYGEFPDCACIGLHPRSDGLDHPGSNLFDHDTQWFCSGVLVSDRVVVTAAHCAPSINRAFLAGRSLSYLGVDGEVARVERVLVHPEYHPDLVPSHDIAVLVLAEAANTTPAPVATHQHVAAQDEVMLVGFGYDHPTADVGFGTKRKVSVRLTQTAGDPDDLVAALERTHGFDSASEFHAGIKGLGKDSCNGDSGGPAYVQSESGFLVAGITSRAAFSADTRCGDGGIYTRITPYLDWIHEVTGGLAGVALERPEPKPRGSTALYVSAAQPNPAGPDDGYEWIEVTNGGSVPLALAEYAVIDKQGGREILDGAIGAGATYRLTLPEGSKVKLANAGDEIVLLRGEAEVHRVSYSAAGKGEVIRFEAPESGASGVVADPCAGTQPPVEGLPADADPC
jgi:endonuclease G